MNSRGGGSKLKSALILETGAGFEAQLDSVVSNAGACHFSPNNIWEQFNQTIQIIILSLKMYDYIVLQALLDTTASPKNTFTTEW